MLPIIDLHCDTLSKLCSAPEDFLLPPEQANSHITLPGLFAVGGMVQCFALFTDLAEWTDRSPISCVKAQLDCFRSLLTVSDGKLVQAVTYEDILQNHKTGNISALLTLEESCLSDTPVSLLPAFYSMGIRIATLTWNHPNLLGYPATPLVPLPLGTSPASLPGLTSAGFDFLAEAERLGILLDVSHLSDAGFYDVASHCTKPFLASHSNARALCGHPRNLTDDMLRTLAIHGGVAGLNLHKPFLISGEASPDDLLDALICHAKHIISAAGIDTLAIGTDFDGIPGNAAIPNVSFLPRLEDALKKAGLTSGEIEKIFYRNALRVFEECL